MQRLLSLILMAAIAVVSWRVYSTWSATEPLASDRVRGRGTQPMDVPSTARTPAPPRLAMSITERDLFDQSRRAPTADVLADTPIPPPNVELIGVVIAGQEPEALIKDTAQGGTLRHVFKGDDVGGYIVSSISPTEVVLTSPAGGKVPLPLALNLTASGSAADRTRSPTAQPAKGQAAAAEQPTAAGASGKGPGAGATSDVRERLRELRRKRQEARKAKQ